MDESRLTDAEKKKGWVAFCCPAHGFLAAGSASLVVVCGRREHQKACRKRADGWRGENLVKTGRMVTRKNRGRSS